MINNSEITETTAENSEEKKPSWKDSILLKTVAFGANGLFITGHLV